MTLQHLPAESRPREKLLARGAAALSDAELLALLLRTGLPGKNVLLLAQELVDRFGGVAGLLHTPADALKSIKGLGPAKRAELVAVLELARRALSEQLRQQPVFDSPQAVGHYLQLQLGAKPHEVFAVLFLDSQNRLLALLPEGRLVHLATLADRGDLALEGITALRATVTPPDVCAVLQDLFDAPETLGDVLTGLGVTPPALPGEREAYENAAAAPSGANHQPWHFAVVSSPEKRREIRLGAEAEERAFYAGKAGKEWLEALASRIGEQVYHEPEVPLALMGDFNIAPLDTDVWNIDDFAGLTHVTPEERQAFEAFEQIGLTDTVRELVPGQYTYWDYKDLCFPKNNGMRIDFCLTSEALTERVVGASIERDERKGEAPSDHVPVVVDID